MSIVTLEYAKSMSKRRITVTVDEALVETAAAAVAEGRAESVSSWVNQAMIAQLQRDQRLSALAELIVEYEADHGVITEDEVAEQAQRDRDSAAAVRGRVRRAV